MLEMKLLRTKEDEKGTYKAYEVGCYIAYVTNHKNPEMLFISVSAKLDANEYAPYIYFEETRFGEVVNEFTIQTTSYGSLDIQEIKKMLDAYNTAVEVVDVLERNFLNKD